MKETIAKANQILRNQGIGWQISQEPVEHSERDIVVRNRFGQVLWRGFTFEAAVAWIIRQDVPEDDFLPASGPELVYEILSRFQRKLNA